MSLKRVNRKSFKKVNTIVRENEIKELTLGPGAPGGPYDIINYKKYLLNRHSKQESIYISKINRKKTEKKDKQA